MLKEELKNSILKMKEFFYFLKYLKEWGRERKKRKKIGRKDSKRKKKKRTNRKISCNSTSAKKTPSPFLLLSHLLSLFFSVPSLLSFFERFRQEKGKNWVTKNWEPKTRHEIQVVLLPQLIYFFSAQFKISLKKKLPKFRFSFVWFDFFCVGWQRDIEKEKREKSYGLKGRVRR